MLGEEVRGTGMTEQPSFESQHAGKQPQQNEENARRNLRRLQMMIAFLGILLGLLIGVSFLSR